VTEYILEAKGIVKTFPGVKALDGVDLKLERGTVHALVGENGAGKSTLMLILGGIYTPDAGKIIVEGEEVSFESSHDANRTGISVVYQELSLVPNLSIAENIFAHRQPVKRFNMVDWKKLFRETKQMLSIFEIDNIAPQTLVSDLSIANKQVVEILKAMSIQPKILILDEPTSSLTDFETQELFENIRKLKSEGIAIIYISHHLPEIFEIADTVTVLRDGKHICDASVQDIDEDFLISNMVGRTIGNIYGERDTNARIGEMMFEAKNISRSEAFEDVSFHINKGEIVAFAGLVGAGRTELGRAIFGAEPIETGELYFEGKRIYIENTKQAIEHGIGYMSEDRKTQGLFVDFDVKTNIVSNHLKDFCGIKGFLSEKKMHTFVKKNVKDFNIITPSILQIMNNLSGGNQQKVLIGTWFGVEPKFLIADEPTRGVDVGAKNEIYKLLRQLAATGVGIMMISSDLSEVLGVSDRIIIMKGGKIAGELRKEEATEENVVGIATGLQKTGKEVSL